MKARDTRDVFEKYRLVAVVRRLDDAAFPRVLAAMVEGGIRVIEITMDGDAAPGQIAHIKREFGAEVVVGAGTVMSVKQTHEAAEAGAEFLVSPHLDVALMEVAEGIGLPFVPGTFSPTEITAALRAGAEVVKLFPAGVLGPDYVRNVLGPLHGIRLMATGGIGEDNLISFLRAGVSAVGMGSNLFPRHDVEAGDWDAIRQRAQRLMTMVNKEMGADS